MRGPGAWWHGKTTPAKVETYTRWSFHSFALIEVCAVGLPAFGELRMPLALWVFLMAVRARPAGFGDRVPGARLDVRSP